MDDVLPFSERDTGNDDGLRYGPLILKAAPKVNLIYQSISRGENTDGQYNTNRKEKLVPIYNKLGSPLVVSLFVSECSSVAGQHPACRSVLLTITVAC